MLPCLAQVSTLGAAFEADVADYAAGRCPAIELWLGKLESYLETHSAADVRELLERHAVEAPVASFQGGLLASQGPARDAHWETFRRRLATCRDLGVATLVVAADIPGPLTQTDLDRVAASLDKAATEAEPHGVRLALEFQARAAFCNNLQTCAAIVEDVGQTNLGVCLDAFHFLTGPSKLADLTRLPPERLFHVQLSDLSGIPRELATDAERILPGEGDGDIEALVATLREIGYRGTVSVELMNPKIWQVPPLQFGEIAMTALRKVLGQAEMGGRPAG